MVTTWTKVAALLLSPSGGATSCWKHKPPLLCCSTVSVKSLVPLEAVNGTTIKISNVPTVKFRSQIKGISDKTAFYFPFFKTYGDNFLILCLGLFNTAEPTGPGVRRCQTASSALRKSHSISRRSKFARQLGLLMWKNLEITRLYLTASNGRKTKVNWLRGSLECQRSSWLDTL